MKEKLFVSFSGGRTSAYMSWLLKTQASDRYDLLFVFANTGQEHPKTLEFVDRCDRAFGLGVVWVEAEVAHGERKRTGHRIVDFTSAARDGRPFESVIQKYGIPNLAFPHCTRELKLNPMYSFVNSVWPEGDYKVAVGIREDEPRRRKKDPKVVYPLMDWWPCDKADVNLWWDEQPFNLEIPEQLGNCTWCWKKSARKHIANILACPEIYDFPRRMEKEYAHAGAGDSARVFFRGARSTDDMFALAAVTDLEYAPPEQPDADGGCSESCEVLEWMGRAE